MYFLATTLYTWARQLHSESTRLLFSFLFRGHIKLQIPSLHTERAATREILEQETVGGFSVIQKTSVKGYHPNMIWAGKANGQTSPLCGLPFLLPRWLRACFHILTPNANFPSRNLQLEPCQLSRAQIHPHESTDRNYFFFFFSWLHKYEALEENNLKPLENGNSLSFLLPEASCCKRGHYSVSQELLLSPKEKLNWNCRIWHSFLQNLKGCVSFFFFFFPNKR